MKIIDFKDIDSSIGEMLDRDSEVWLSKHVAMTLWTNREDLEFFARIYDSITISYDGGYLLKKEIL